MLQHDLHSGHPGAGVSWGKRPRIQILTIAELLAGKKIDYPPAQGVNVTYQKAPRAKTTKAKQQKLELE